MTAAEKGDDGTWEPCELHIRFGGLSLQCGQRQIYFCRFVNKDHGNIHLQAEHRENLANLRSVLTHGFCGRDSCTKFQRTDCRFVIACLSCRNKIQRWMQANKSPFNFVWPPSIRIGTGLVENRDGAASALKNAGTGGGVAAARDLRVSPMPMLTRSTVAKIVSPVASTNNAVCVERESVTPAPDPVADESMAADSHPSSETSSGESKRTQSSQSLHVGKKRYKVGNAQLIDRTPSKRKYRSNKVVPLPVSSGSNSSVGNTEEEDEGREVAADLEENRIYNFRLAVSERFTDAGLRILGLITIADSKGLKPSKKKALMFSQLFKLPTFVRAASDAMKSLGTGANHSHWQVP